MIAGWTGRDPAAVEKHIRELEALGVKRPATTPIFYRVAAARLTTDDSIEAVGESSGGEVEFVLLQHAGRLWVGAGSDHTDREVEKYGVTVSKQMCDKPIARCSGPTTRSRRIGTGCCCAPTWSKAASARSTRKAPVTAMLDPQRLIARSLPSGSLPDGTLMFCGTLAAHGGVRPTSEFEFELEDPVLGRKIAHGYRVRTLPVLG